MRKEALAIITTASLLTGCSAVGMERASESIKTTTVTVYPTPEVSSPENTPFQETLESTTSDALPAPADAPSATKSNPSKVRHTNEIYPSVERIDEKKLAIYAHIFELYGKSDPQDMFRKVLDTHTKSGAVKQYVELDPEDSTHITSIEIKIGDITTDNSLLLMSEKSDKRTINDGLYIGPGEVVTGTPSITNGVVDSFTGFGQTEQLDTLIQCIKPTSDNGDYSSGCNYSSGDDTDKLFLRVQSQYRKIVNDTIAKYPVK